MPLTKLEMIKKKNAVSYCECGETVHFLILEGCSKCVVVRMSRLVIKCIDSCRNEDFLPLVGNKRQVTQGDGQGLAKLLRENCLFCLLFA